MLYTTVNYEWNWCIWLETKCDIAVADTNDADIIPVCLPCVTQDTKIVWGMVNSLYKVSDLQTFNFFFFPFLIYEGHWKGIVLLYMPFNSICNMTYFWKADFSPLTLWSLNGPIVIVLACMLFYSLCPLIWYATWPTSEFWPLNPTPQYINSLIGSAVAQW